MNCLNSSASLINIDHSDFFVEKRMLIFDANMISNFRCLNFCSLMKANLTQMQQFILFKFEFFYADTKFVRA
jgi:hypothetical protein